MTDPTGSSSKRRRSRRQSRRSDAALADQVASVSTLLGIGRRSHAAAPRKTLRQIITETEGPRRTRLWVLAVIAVVLVWQIVSSHVSFQFERAAMAALSFEDRALAEADEMMKDSESFAVTAEASRPSGAADTGPEAEGDAKADVELKTLGGEPRVVAGECAPDPAKVGAGPAATAPGGAGSTPQPGSPPGTAAATCAEPAPPAPEPSDATLADPREPDLIGRPSIAKVKALAPEVRADIRGRAEAMLASHPLNPRAFRVLGQLAAADGDDSRAEAFMKAATRTSLHEPIAVSWLAGRTFETENYADAAYYADAVMRLRPDLVKAVTPLVARMAETEPATSAVKTILANNPPWRGQFFAMLNSTITDARTPLELLISLRETEVPPTSAEISGYLQFLVSRDFHELAYYTWLHFLTRSQMSKVRPLYNGSFEYDLTHPPFDWTISKTSGATVQILADPDAADGNKLLNVEFGYGRVEFRGGVREVVLLTPGTYTFAGRYKGDVSGKRGLVWQVQCIRGAVLGQSELFVGASAGWASFSFPFEVPEAGCRAQLVWLTLAARSMSERFVSGAISFDDLSVTRSDLATARPGAAQPPVALPSRP